MSTSFQQQQREKESNNKITTGCIVVVAKCPIPGKSKTRLVPLLGEDGSSKLAKAMLSDVLLTLEHCPELNQVVKVLLYAPGDETGCSIMKGIMKEIGVDAEGYDIIDGATAEEFNGGISSSSWQLLPMVSPNLQSSDLGGILQHALNRVVMMMDAGWNQKQGLSMNNSHGVVFLGMDSPEIPLLDIVKGLNLASSKKAMENVGEHNDDTSDCRPAALLCPSDDGGYGMLCAPSTSVNMGIFQKVYWSHSLTAVSQLKALTDAFIPVVIGRLMHDIDEPEDVHKLSQRLSKVESSTAKSQPMGLEMFSSYDESGYGMNHHTGIATKIVSKHEECKYTKLALKELGMLASFDSKK